MYIDLHVKYPLFLSDLMKIEFSGHIYKKYSNIRFRGNPSSDSRIVLCGQMDTKTRQSDRYDEVNSRFSQFCKRVFKPLFKRELSALISR
jgi:hypothetical protein